jgi:hypothetical protein
MTSHTRYLHTRKMGSGRPLTVFLCATILTGQGLWARASPAAWPCGEHAEILKDHQGKDVWLTSGVLEKLVIRRVDPKLPSSLSVHATVPVDIILGPSGTVLCARALEGHPILRAAATEAALGWIFKPYRVNGKAVEVFGHLSMKISTSTNMPRHEPR